MQDLNEFNRERTQVKKAYPLGAAPSILAWLVLPVLSVIRKILDQAKVRLDTLLSHPLVEAGKERRVYFAIVRDDALPENSRRYPVRRITFHLCLPRWLLKQGAPPSAIDDVRLWQTLPFTVGKYGGQLDRSIRQAMRDAGVEFRPLVECNSRLQARQLMGRGECAGIHPSMGIHGLESKDIIIRAFAPLEDFGRYLVPH